MLVLPLLLAAAGFLVGGAAGLAWLALLLGLPAAMLATLVGWGLGHLTDRRSLLLAGAFYAVALGPVAWALAETFKRGEPVSAEVQAALPTEISLGNLCPGTETPKDVERDVRRRAEALIRQLKRDPNALVIDTYFYSDDPPERRKITVRELAEERLMDMKSNGPGCAPRLARRIRAAMTS